MTSDSTEEGTRSFAFGPFVLIPERQLLLRDDVPVRIGSRALDILTALVEQPGELMTKRELMARAWPNTVVDEGNLKVNMAALRRVLGDGSGAARYIATVTGRGYRFIAPLRVNETPRSATTSWTVKEHGHNLPIATTTIFGRSDAITLVRRDLEDNRLVSIVGAGGIGKTTVALAVAEQALGALKDGIWLVDLAVLTDPALVPNALASAVGIPIGSADVLSILCEQLRDRDVLLLLDSCEHIIDSVASCADRILTTTAGVRILATSREALRVKGERVRRLPGLDAPPPMPRLSATDALAFPAIQLFVERATDSFEQYTLSDADASTVAEICRKLDGLALAIELAATRIEAFGAAGLLKQLDNWFYLLSGRRAGPERHRTLAATLDWSYSQLSPVEATLMRSVSAFAGIFGVEGAVAVSNIGRGEVVKSLAQLAAKSLLTVEWGSDGATYRLLETTRTFCLERLHASGETQAVRRRHAEHVVMVLERATAEWAQRPAREWEAAYRGVINDLRGALAWTGRNPADRLLLIQLTLAANLLWNHFSLNEECRVHASKALGELDVAGLSGTATEMRLQASLAGAIICTRGLLPEATNAARRALDIAVDQGDFDFHLRCLHIIGMNEFVGGELDAGLRTLQAFAGLAAEVDQAAVQAGEAHVAMVEWHVGRLGSAGERIEALKLPLPKDVDGSNIARFLWDAAVVARMALSHVQWLRGHVDTGARTVLTAVEYARKTRHELSVANALAFTCPIFFLSGLHDACRRYVAMLDEQALRYGIIAWLPVARFYRGALACAMGDAGDSGLDEIREALGELRIRNHMVRFPFYLGVLAGELAKRARLDEAERTILEAMDAAHRQNERWCMPELLRIHGSILTASGQRDRAETRLLESITSAGEIDALSWRLRSANDLAALWRDASRTDDARRLLLPIFSEFNEGYGTHDLLVAKDLLASLTPGIGATNAAG